VERAARLRSRTWFRLEPGKKLAALIRRYGRKLAIRLSVTYTPSQGVARTTSRTVRLL
jgi:hypothetical protein